MSNYRLPLNGVPQRYRSPIGGQFLQDEVDLYFDSVVLLLHMDGANSSVVFPDVKGKPVIPSGDAKISTAQSKFGGASALFDGNGDYLSVPISADMQFGSTDLTWECWVRPSVVATVTPMTILGNAEGFQPGNAGLFMIIQNSRFQFRHWVYDSTSAISSQTIAINTWYHVAVVKVGTALKIFVNGIAGTDGSTDLVNQDSQFRIGSTVANAGYAIDFQGYIDEVRISRTARYTQSFVPPTTYFPGTASNTDLPALPGLAMWGSSDSVLLDSNNFVSQVNDQSGNSRHLTQLTEDRRPLYVSNGFSGKPVLRFNNTYLNKFDFTEVSTIRTVYWVIKLTASQGHFLLGHDVSFDFHGDSLTWFNQTYASTSILSKLIFRVNGITTSTTATKTINQMVTISLVTSANVIANSYSSDRNDYYTTASLYGDFLALFIYTQPHTAAQVTQMESYLQLKYAHY